MSEFDYDYFVIGAGSGGLRSARIAASLGAKVGIAEAAALGGTCVNVGCVPKKMFAYASDHYKHIQDAAGYGWEVEKPVFNWDTLRNNKNAAIERTNNFFDKMLNENGIDIHRGFAKFVGEHTIEIDDKKITADKFVIATGGRPRIDGFEGSEHAITSNGAFFLDHLPNSVVIYGGGYIAVEFAHIYEGLGLDVTLVYRGDLLLRGFDQELREHLTDEMEEQGINLILNTEIQKVTTEGYGYQVDLSDGQTLHTEMVFSAIGRIPETDKIGLDDLGVKKNDAGYIDVNDGFQTNIPNIYAVGDIIGREELTPVAIRHGHKLALQLFSKEDDGKSYEYDFVPTAVFSRPELGICGYTEEEAIEKFGKVDVYCSYFKPLAYTLPQREEKTLIKLIVSREDDRVVGLHMAGPHAGEIVQGFGVALQAGATKADFDRTVAIHPTSAEEFVTMREPARSHG